MRMKWLRGGLRWVMRRGVPLMLWALVIVFVLPRSTAPIHDFNFRLAYEISGGYFDYVGWTLNALASKARQTLYGVHPYLSEAERSDFVREYMADVAQAQRLEAEIAAVYSDPNVADAAQATAELRERRDALRASLEARQWIAEGILEGQVAAVLIAEGFGIAGQLVPPMAMHMTRVPNLLVASPRDAIRLEVSLNLLPLAVDEMNALEERLAEAYELSALVVNLGGIALYPAMILETSSIAFAVETFAHEWLHHYLYFFPLGLAYFVTPEGLNAEARSINETTASLFGKEIGRRVLERYYPELVPPPPPPPRPAGESTPSPTSEPPAFDLGREMHVTRVRVDELLAAGQVEEAEAYMEERRRFFYENGYRFRRINQAFFAFYGGYQAEGIPGIAGEDPIGPAVQEIRERLPSAREFVLALRGLTTREELLALRDGLRDP